MKTNIKINFPDLAIILFLILFSFFLTLEAGQRGFFAYDQSVTFDGGYRIFSGQIPYKDFLTPYGLTVFWIQALFFRLLGVSYSTYVLTAAFFNILATLCSIVLIRLFFPGRKYLSYITGLLTGIWFYPPFGTFHAEQTSFFLNLVTVTFILAGGFLKRAALISNGLLLLSGSLAFLSLLAKQNAGIFIFPLYLFLIIFLYRPGLKNILYKLAVFSCGFISNVCIFYFWLIANSNIEVFLKHFLYLPLLTGSSRFSLEKVNFFSGVCVDTPFHILPMGIRFILGASFIIAAGSLGYLIYKHNKYSNAADKRLIASFLLIYLFFYQYLFIHSTMNQAEDGIPFIGIIFVLALGLFTDLAIGLYIRGQKTAPFRVRMNNGRSVFALGNREALARGASFKQKIIRILFIIAVTYFIIYLSVIGIRVSLSRKVQEFNNSVFSSFTVKELRGLKWGNPTKIRGREVKKEEIEDVLRYLKAKNENFFVFSDFTLFYGLVGKPSPQPLIYFYRGLTYPVSYDLGLDNWIVASLKKNKIKVVVMEEVSMWGSKALDDFPVLKAYIANNFTLIRKIGIFNIMELAIKKTQ